MTALLRQVGYPLPGRVPRAENCPLFTHAQSSTCSDPIWQHSDRDPRREAGRSYSTGSGIRSVFKGKWPKRLRWEMRYGRTTATASGLMRCPSAVSWGHDLRQVHDVMKDHQIANERIVPDDLALGVRSLNHLFFWSELYRRTRELSISFLFDENPVVASVARSVRRSEGREVMRIAPLARTQSER